jgi:hypothetical protein
MKVSYENTPIVLFTQCQKSLEQLITGSLHKLDFVYQRRGKVVRPKRKAQEFKTEYISLIGLFPSMSI